MEAEGLPDEIPIHSDCGLPVELCICTDAPVAFEDGRFIHHESRAAQAAYRVGDAIHLNLDLPDGEDEARRLMEEGLKVRVVCIETSEVECPACEWGRNIALVFDCVIGSNGDIPTWTLCQSCGHHIELSVELLSVLRRAFEGKI